MMKIDKTDILIGGLSGLKILQNIAMVGPGSCKKRATELFSTKHEKFIQNGVFRDEKVNVMGVLI